MRLIPWHNEHSEALKKTAKSQRGDTIVEVLIAIAIVSLILAGAYASTNHNVHGIQDTQEHSQALQLVQTQVEFLGAQKSIDTTHFQCFNPSGSPATACNFKADGSVDISHDQPEYTLSITNAGDGVFEVKASWDSVLGNSAQVSIFYRPQVAG